MPSAISRELSEAFNFHVVVDGDVGAPNTFFSRVGPLEVDITYSSYKEAGAVIPIKDPEDVSFPDITLETGASRSQDFYDWVQTTVRAATGMLDGRPIFPGFKRNVGIYQYDRVKKVTKKYSLHNAFPRHFVAGEWDNAKDEVVIERLVLAYDYFRVESVRRTT